MASQKPHIVCIPAPLQGHLNPMIKLAKLLHSKGFYITLVLTDFYFAKLTSSMSKDFLSLQSLQDFRIETISDGMPPSDKKRGALELEEMVVRFFWGDQLKNVVRSLLTRLLDSLDITPISNVILDCLMYFPLGVCKEFGIQVLIFFTTSACAMLAFMQYDELVKRGHFPSKDESYLTNGYLDLPIDWVPTLIKGAKMKHLPTYVRSTNPNDTMFNFLAEGIRQTFIADGIILNTFANLEAPILETVKAKAPKLFVVGPLALLCQQHELLPLTLSLWEEDTTCLEWLNTRSPKSVIYVNYGSLAMLSLEQLQEFAWGLANSNHPFLWVIRSDLVEGLTSIITNEYMEEIKGKGLIISWCSQEKVLKHPSIAVFLTHCGWNSMLESINEGVPMICWPCFSDQIMNCLYACQEWRIGLEMEEGEVKRDKVEELVREMMEGEKGKELKRNVLEWKKKAQEATRYGGSSNTDFDELVKFLK